MKYTDGEYLRKHPMWHAEDSQWKARQIIKIMERNDLQPKSICEVGCGAGEILNQLYLKMDETVSFVGYEISPQAFDLCQQRKKDRLQYKLTNPFEEEKHIFDLVLAIDVIEHVEDYFGFLKSLREMGSYKIFHIPLDLTVRAVLWNSTILRSRQNDGHIHYFTKETALATLNDTGYRIIDYFYTSKAIDLPGKSLKSLVGRFARKTLYGLNSDITVRIFGGYSLMVLTE